MNLHSTSVKRVLISVSDKTGIVDFARALAQLDIEIISTGGTSQLLRGENIPVQDISAFTQFPEMMDGRVKTLHPLVHGGILGLRDKHQAVAWANNIQWIDLVIVNLYPFAATIQKPNATFDQAIETIDIGGPAMLRSAAKNLGWCGVIVNPADYAEVLTELQSTQQLTYQTKKRLAKKAFQHTADYDATIFAYLNQDEKVANEFSPIMHLRLTKYADLRYGENPHQQACVYQQQSHPSGILQAHQHQGKALSYNNLVDTDAALNCLREFLQPACVIVKHATPCGVAIGETVSDAFDRALQADKQSAFGGIIALNALCDEHIAAVIANIFVEVVVAPAFSPAALAIFAQKPNVRILELDTTVTTSATHEFKFIDGAILTQSKDATRLQSHDLNWVTLKKPDSRDIENSLFAWRALKHVKSNAILFAKNGVTLGIGPGQVSRIDAVDIAVRKAGDQVRGSVMASDAFFPFRDSIDRIADYGVSTIIQPGGSIKDHEVIAACNEHHIAMAFTGKRCFKH